MSFTGNEGESISLSTAGEMTLAFRNSIIINILTGLLNPLFPLSHKIDKENLQELLDQEDCVGVRAYQTIESDLKHAIVLVGVDSDENDLVGGIVLDKTGASINLTTASSLTQAFRTSITNILTGLLNPNIPICYFMGKENLQELLDQENCVAVRIYYGIDDEDDKKSTIYVGVDDEDEDLSNGILLDRGPRCPPNCASANVLNSNS